MHQPRLPWTRLAPKAYQAMAAVNATTANSTLGPVLIELVQSRVSQLNGCAFCVDMHTRSLREHGERWQRINNLSTWREVHFYSERERAALHWAEVMTRLTDPHHGDRGADFEKLKPHFTDQEIVELSWTIAQINAWNRMAIGMGVPVEEKGLD
ncbi:carboxymuconolactone decarboxylase family protein [Azohydromonas caseinilytica]|uniref:Carboxymuconolactone decarboxylase family protein n=1 Tax=Azohydromonas caseinilytica TaxID=2728836 RepID=A0A848FAR9_9BURK|nr:carboxymuconolactone decarboxylase family protein [Azohydromonas caseinilytica]NML16422.1 carboxymuconolactone decarboxylase family protein [Azohydromonas caseinilytica]